MPTQTSYAEGTPVELLLTPTPPSESGRATNSQTDEEARNFVIAWRNRLRQERIEKLHLWNECWALYRGKEDFSNKEDWQSKIVLPKAWSTVKQAVNVIKRFLNTAKKPWHATPTNPSDPLGQLRSEKMTDITKVFLDEAHFLEEFATGLETGFIMGMGVWKVGWWLKERSRMKVQTSLQQFNPSQVSGASPQPPQGPALPGLSPDTGGQPAALAGQDILQPPIQRGLPQPLGQQPNELQQQQNTIFPTQLPNEATLPPGALAGGQIQPSPLQSGLMLPTKQIVREDVMEGHLFTIAVDPYNFYWLPGSKFNRWTGTIEEIEVPKWQLMEMAEQGAFDPAMIAQVGPMQIDEYHKQSFLRFGELPRVTNGVSPETAIVKLTEFYGPLIINGRIVEKNAHIIIANDTWVIKNGKNDKWHGKPPYCAFSPLQLPFRTEGIGLVEMVRHIDKALNQIVNLGVDTLLFRLLPVFEFTPDFYENPEDMRTGLTPGKVFRRNGLAGGSDSGLKPIQFEDVSPGASQVAGILDRAHQEGGLVSELQQSLPRWSGAQTATETEAIQENQSSFFGSLASDIEMFAICPIIQMAIDTIMQYIDTANDPRIPAILGVSAPILQGMTQAEILEMIQGDYEVVVKGLSDNLEKGEMLQQLIQFMNLIGQNPEAWLPYINQDAMLRRILESFRPAIHDIEDIIADPQTIAANKQAQMQKESAGQFIGMIPELARLAHESSQAKAQVQQQQQDTAVNATQKAADQAIQIKQIEAAKHAPPGKSK